MSKNLILSAVVALVVAGVIVVGFYPRVNVNALAQEVIAKVQEALGAVPGTDIDSTVLSVGGMRLGFVKTSIVATSSRLCAIKNPIGATTTVESAGVLITSNGIADAQLLSISTSTTAFASSTTAFVYEYSLAASVQNHVAWSPQAATTTNVNLIKGFDSTGRNNYILGPTEWLTFRIATGTAGTFANYYVGNCTASFQEI